MKSHSECHIHQEWILIYSSTFLKAYVLFNYGFSRCRYSQVAVKVQQSTVRAATLRSQMDASIRLSMGSSNGPASRRATRTCATRAQTPRHWHRPLEYSFSPWRLQQPPLTSGGRRDLKMSSVCDNDYPSTGIVEANQFLVLIKEYKNQSHRLLGI